MNGTVNKTLTMREAINVLKDNIEDPTVGLPEEIFQFATEITPMVNVDLLIKDDKGRILLSWRDDEFCGTGWHVIGGIVRLKESLETRIQKTALKELGVEVIYNNIPLEVKELIHRNQTIRSHFYSFVYECRLPEKFDLKEQTKKNSECGFLKWHEHYPENMIPVHSFYRKYFK